MDIAADGWTSVPVEEDGAIAAWVLSDALGVGYVFESVSEHIGVRIAPDQGPKLGHRDEASQIKGLGLGVSEGQRSTDVRLPCREERGLKAMQLKGRWHPGREEAGKGGQREHAKRSRQSETKRQGATRKVSSVGLKVNLRKGGLQTLQGRYLRLEVSEK